jgi:acetylornithine deacetylase/succinyl-diaminopimelate desuccinylase-like protein
MVNDASTYLNREKVEELLFDLVRIYSPYFHENDVMDYVYQWFHKKGIPSEYHHYHEKKVTDFRGTNIIGRLKGQDYGPVILLNGHLDTVEICEGWKRDPLGAEIEGNKLYGVGALDMKAGCASIMLAVEAFAKTFDSFKGEILYTLVSDEEGPYGLGTDALILDGILDHVDVAIVPEPSSGFCGIPFPCLCLGARGGLNYTVNFTGKSAHAAYPEQGINAIIEASKVLLELKESESKTDPKLGKGSLCIIGVNGGGAACSVADQASFTVFRHVVRGEDLDYLRKEVNQAIKRANIKGRAAMKFRDALHTENAGFQPYVTSESNPYTDIMKESILSATGKKGTIAYFASIGDFNYLGSRLKLPTYVFGPGGENFHTADEYVNLDTVVKTSETIYHFLKSILVEK